ncbi:MAG: ATP-binding protein [Methylococcales bacterium]|nr:ATP-binding protein [Methylococcales bacterium]MDD5754007.1 ATP-binding protein [Methylococcales bacterium]
MKKIPADIQKVPRRNKTAKTKKYTVTSITYSLCGLTMMGILILTVVTSIQVDRFLRDELRLRIHDVVTMMAKEIDGDLHSKIQTVEDDTKESYIKLVSKLWDMREHGTEIANAYTMRKLDNGNFVFVVDGSKKDVNATGDIYPSEEITEEFASVFNATPENNEIHIEPEIYTDDWGVWLSAYAPIFTSSGKLDAVVGIDVSAKSIREHQLQYIFTIFIASLVVILITLPFVFRLMNFIRAMTTELERANKDFRSLLDNSGQGFLSFGTNLIIDNEYSRACESMLGEIPAGKYAAEVFFHDDKTKTDLFNTIISSVQNETDEFVRENMLSLLPAEIQHNELILKAEYKILEHDKFMVVLTDITQERQIAAMLDKERLHLELIVLAISDSRNFFDLVEAFRKFLSQELPQMLSDSMSPQILAKELYREIHTYKGLLNQFSFPNTPKILHEIESHLSNLLTLGDTLTYQQITDIISSGMLQIPFNEDLSILSKALGDKFLAHGESIVLTCEQALQMEKLAYRLLCGEAVDTSISEVRKLLNEISTLRKVSFKDVLMGFNGLVQQAAERMEKEVAPIVVKGGSDIWIDPCAYQAFLRSLVHVFRNTVAHGIESPEVRWEMDKDEVGKITCYVAIVGDAIKLTIADDGAGINLEALREKVITAGIYTADEVAAFSDEEIIKFIFMDNVSTQQEVTELAGRGVGLAAVLNETKNIGGDLTVKTVVGQGTQFLFTLPLQ